MYCPLELHNQVINLVELHFSSEIRNYPLISIYDGEFINIFHFYNLEAYKVSNILPIKKSIIEYKNKYIVEDNDDNEYKAYKQNINNLNKILIK
ncbi:26982_t:CDS:2, partial [Gigaspora margarita]